MINGYKVLLIIQNKKKKAKLYQQKKDYSYN